MALRPLLQFQNPDSTRDINDRSRVYNKGVFSGGEVKSGTVADGLAVRLEAFATVGADGMFVEEIEDTLLPVSDGVDNFIVLRSVYRDNAEPTVQLESISEAAYLSDPELEFLIVFAVVEVPLSATFITQDLIFYQESDRVDTLGRLSLRGTLTNAGSLPDWNSGNPTISNTNRPGDFYTITSGEDDIPEIYVWTGSSDSSFAGRWINVTQTQVLSTLLQEHIDNLSNDAKHLSNGEKEAAQGTAGLPSSFNKYVTELDPRVPAQNENDGMTGDPTILSGPCLSGSEAWYNGGAGDEDYRGCEPHSFNQFTLNSKVFATPAEKAFAGSAVIELQESDGPLYVGREALGTAQQWFNIFEASVAAGPDFLPVDKELVNSQGRTVKVTGVFTEASLTNELDPAVHPSVDANGFWRRKEDQFQDAFGSLFLEVSDKDVDGQADVDFQISYGRRTTMENLLPQAFLSRGPQFGQLDTRAHQVDVTDTTPNFRDAEWDVATSPGDVIAFDSVGGDMVQHDIPGNLFPVGIRGNFNNLIQDGIYEFPAPSAFVAGDEVYADTVTPGAMTVTPNDRFVGTFLTDTKLLVSMNSIGISSTVVPPGTAFPGGLINASPGQVVAWRASAGEFQPWELSWAFAPMGVLGNSNNIITNEQWVPGGGPFLTGVRYYAWYAGAPGGVLTPGDMTTTQNDYFVGRGILTTSLMVECINAPNWENSRQVFDIEHHWLDGTHDEGSARSWIGLEADRFAASNNLATSTGMIFYATDTGRTFYCTNGAGNTWVETTRFSGPLAITNNLTAESQIRMPAKVLHDDVSDSMNPFEHAARHFLGGTDYLGGRVEQILSAGDVSTRALAATGAFPLPVTVVQSLAFDFTGRTDESLILIFAPCFFDQQSGQADMSGALFLDGLEITNPNSIRMEWELDDAGENSFTMMGYLSDVSAGAHTLEVRVGVQNSTPQARETALIVVDLGLA